MSNFPRFISGLGVAFVLQACIVPASMGQQQGLESYIETDLQPLMRKPQILEAIKASNKDHADDTAEKIMAKDNEWRSEFGKSQQSFIQMVLSNPTSQMAKAKISEAKGLISEIIIMDAKGLTVGCWPATADYYQGDEDQHKLTFQKGAGARHLGPERLDESTRLPQRQLSLTVVDPDNGTPIGAITFGLDSDHLR